MELHHKLRRDPSWHPNSCNICGQMGHQAAHCTVGTVNWRALYGDHSFILRPPVFPSQIYAKQKARQIDFEDLEKRAKEFAKAREEGRVPAELQNQPTQPHAAAAPPTTAAAPPPEAQGLPPGWSIARDGQGKIYYWHTETKKVQWNKPTLEGEDQQPANNGTETPAGDVAMAPQQAGESKGEQQHATEAIKQEDGVPPAQTEVKMET